MNFKIFYQNAFFIFVFYFSALHNTSWYTQISLSSLCDFKISSAYSTACTAHFSSLLDLQWARMPGRKISRVHFSSFRFRQSRRRLCIIKNSRGNTWKCQRAREGKKLWKLQARSCLYTGPLHPQRGRLTTGAAGVERNAHASWKYIIYIFTPATGTQWMYNIWLWPIDICRFVFWVKK